VIQSLDLSKARIAEGVRGVFTLADVPGQKIFGPVKADETLFADREVLYLGQPLAMVVAETAEQARRALAGCFAEIEELPAVVCPREAFAQGLLLQETRVFAKGDVDSVWDQCAHIVEGEVDLAGQEHLYLETNRARVLPREDDQYMVYSSTQSPTAVQKHVAQLLGLPMHKIEVDVKRLGGGFGGKEDQATHWACMCAVAAWHLRKPVQLVLNRVEDIRMTGKRHPYKQDFKLGLDSEGRILAADFKHFQNSGAYMDLSGPVLERTVLHSTNAYAIPHVRILAATCRTNLPSNTAYRGFGGPQGMFLMECALAKAAEVTGISRETLQERNLIEDGYVFHYGQEVTECRMKRTWREAAADFDFLGTRERIDSFNTRHRMQKKGMAVMPVCFGISFTKTFLNQGSSLVHIYTDGSVSVTTGGIEMGQGVSSNMIAIAARTFGIPPSKVKSNSTNTSRIANISPSAASATTDLNGNATILACREILPGLQKTVIEMLGRPETDAARVRFVDGVAYVGEDPTELVWEKVVGAAYMRRRQLMAHGFYAPPNIHFDGVTGKGRPFHYYTYGTCLVEVTVDCLRGTYKIDAIKLVHDLGRTIVPTIDLGQVEGGITQGIGWVTLEELAFDEKGRTTSHALSTYKAPDAEFMPDRFDIKFLENVTNDGGPLGSKAVGEPPFMYGIAAYFALRDAITTFRGSAPSGPLRSPLTPEQTLLSLYR
jgi:xanthine dehydrogenase large subunit